MTEQTSAEEVTMTIVPITTATISFIASSLIIAMIYRSRKKLKDAYRRIVFGMSLFDILSSFAVALKIFKSTPDSNMWLPLGNQTSCNILGFLHIIGTVGTPIYSVNLNVYYYYLVKQNMREEVFRKKIEPWLHGLPVVWSIVGGIYIWVAKLINPSPSGGCFIATAPLGCEKNDDVECSRGQKQMLVTMAYLGVPLVLCLIISIALLIAIWYKVRAQEIRMDRYRIRRVSVNLRVSLNDDEYDDNSDLIFSKMLMKVKRLRQKRQLKKRTECNSRAFLWSAIWYAVAFMITFTFPYIVVVMNMVGMESPFIVKLLSRLLQPLQGLFNILVYTRPHIKVCRQLNPQMTWFQAFCYVIKSGGDDDRNPNERGRRNSRRSLASSGSLRSSGRKSSDDSIGKHRNSMFGPLKRQSTTNMEAHSMKRNTNTLIDTKSSHSDSNRDLSNAAVAVQDNARYKKRLSHMTVDSQHSGILDSPETDVENSFEANEKPGEKGGSVTGDSKNKNQATSSNHSRRRSVTFACDDEITSHHIPSSVPYECEENDDGMEVGTSQSLDVSIPNDEDTSEEDILQESIIPIDTVEEASTGQKEIDVGHLRDCQS